MNSIPVQACAFIIVIIFIALCQTRPTEEKKKLGPSHPCVSCRRLCSERGGGSGSVPGQRGLQVVQRSDGLRLPVHEQQGRSFSGAAAGRVRPSGEAFQWCDPVKHPLGWKSDLKRRSLILNQEHRCGNSDMQQMIKHDYWWSVVLIFPANLPKMVSFTLKTFFHISWIKSVTYIQLYLIFINMQADICFAEQC